MTVFIRFCFLPAIAICFSSCCISHGKAIRVHNLSGKPVFNPVTRSQVEKIPRLGHDSFYVPAEHLLHPYRTADGETVSARVPNHRKAEFKIQDADGRQFVYSGFDFENHAGPTYKRWYDPDWSCVERRYRAVLKPDMSLKFGEQIIIPVPVSPEQ